MFFLKKIPFNPLKIWISEVRLSLKLTKPTTKKPSIKRLLFWRLVVEQKRWVIINKMICYSDSLEKWITQTPSGRHMIRTVICTSAIGFHVFQWQPLPLVIVNLNGGALLLSVCQRLDSRYMKSRFLGVLSEFSIEHNLKISRRTIANNAHNVYLPPPPSALSQPFPINSIF